MWSGPPGRREGLGTDGPLARPVSAYEDLRRYCHERIAAELRLDLVPPSQRAQTVRTAVSGYLYDRRAGLSPQDREKLIEEIVQDVVGYGPITPLLEDDSITEIMVNGPDRVFVESGGVIRPAGVRFRDERHLMQVIERIVAQVGRRIDEGSPMVDARLPDGSRVNVVIPPISRVGPVLTVRKFARNRMGLDDLVRLGTLPEKTAEFLRRCVHARLSILVCGSAGAGKTTLLNVLSSWIDRSERIVSIEDTAELRLDHPHWIQLESRPPNIEGKGEVTLRDLLRNALRMRPDRILVGEVRGAEAWELIKALNTGHEGGMSTIHANSPEEALEKLAQYLMETGSQVPPEVLYRWIADAIHLVVHVRRYRDGVRRVASVVEVDGADRSGVRVRELVAFRYGLENGEMSGRFVQVGVPRRVAEEFSRRGIELGEVVLV